MLESGDALNRRGRTSVTLGFFSFFSPAICFPAKPWIRPTSTAEGRGGREKREQPSAIRCNRNPLQHSAPLPRIIVVVSQLPLEVGGTSERAIDPDSG